MSLGWMRSPFCLFYFLSFTGEKDRQEIWKCHRENFLSDFHGKAFLPGSGAPALPVIMTLCFYLILFKNFGRDKFGPIKEQYPSLQCQSDDVIVTSSSHW